MKNENLILKTIQKYSESYLFERHSKETLRYWLNNLKYFYFNRAWGGHANDGDCFVAFFQINDEQELLTIASNIGLDLEILPDNNPKPIKGKSYTSKEYNKFKIEITNFPKYKQPGRNLIQGIESFLWVDDNNLLKISISGSSDKNYYVVSEQDFRDSQKLEVWFYKRGMNPFRDKLIEERATIISRSKYYQLLYPKNIANHIKYLENHLNSLLEIHSIEYLRKLPNGINYITWSIGDVENDRSFKIYATDKNNKEKEVYAQTKSVFGFIFRAMYWIKDEQKYRRLKIKKS